MVDLSIQEAVKFLRRYDTEYYTPQTRRAHQMAIEALLEKDRRPLTISELRKMGGQKVYCLELNAEVKVSAPEVGFISVSYSISGEWGSCKADKLTLFRHRPEEVA